MGKMVMSNLSENDAIHSPLFFMCHGNSPYYIQWFSVIAYLKQDNDNPYGVIYEGDSPLDSINKLRCTILWEMKIVRVVNGFAFFL